MPPVKGGKNVLSELWINIRGDLSDLSRSLKSSDREIRTFVGRLGSVNKELRDVGKRITLVSTALIGVGIVATKVFADFEQSMANVQSVVGAGANELKILEDAAREAGRTTVFTATESAQAMFFLAQAGFKTQQVVGALQGVLSLATATQSDLAFTSNLLVGTLNQFNLEAEQAGEVANVFAASIANSLANMDKLRDSLKFVGPVAALFGESIESTTAALNLLFNAGLTATIAGTQLRQIMLRLVAPTKGAKVALEELGIGLNNVNPEFNSLKDIVAEFEKIDLSRSGKQLKDIFGIRAIAPFTVLVRAGSDALEGMEESITGTEKATEQARIQIDNIKGAIKLLISALQEAAIAAAAGLEPAVRLIVSVLRDAVQLFNAWPASLKEAALVIPTLVGLLGLLVGPLFLIAGMLPKIVAGALALKLAMGAAAGPIGIVTVAIIALTTATGAFISAERRRIEAIQDSLRLTNENIGSLVKARTEGLKLAQSFLEIDKKQSGAVASSDEQNKILEKIDKVMPGLIASTGDYALTLDSVTRFAAEATTELEELAKIQKDLKNVELLLQDLEFRRQIRELQEDLGNVSFFEKFGNVQIPIGLIKDEIDDLLKSAELIANLELPASSLFGRLPGAAVGARDLATELEKVAQTQEGFRDITKDLSAIQTLISSKEAEILELEVKRGLTGGKQQELLDGRLRGLTKEQEVLLQIQEIFAASIRDTAELKRLQTELAAVERTRAELLKGDRGEEPEKKPVIIKPEVDDEKARKKLAELAAFRLSLAQQTLDAIADGEAASLNTSFEQRLRALEAEEKAVSFALEIEKLKALEEAKKLGAERIEIEKAFQVKRNAIVEEFVSERVALENEFVDRRNEAELRRLRFLTEINELSLQEFIANLQLRLEAAEEFSEEWMKIQREIFRAEKELNKSREQETKQMIGFQIKAANILGEAFGNAVAGVDQDWKEVLKSLVDLIANTYKAILVQTKLFAAGVFPPNFAAIANAAFAIAGISAVQAAVKGLIDKAAVGAIVKTGGLLQVDPNEAVVPASIVRDTREGFRNRLLGVTGPTEPEFPGEARTGEQATGGGSGLTIMGDLVLQNPIVDRVDYWEGVIDDALETALENKSKRIGNN